MTLFFNADIVLCPHGANSANCLYMHQGAVFAEMFSDSWHAPMNTEICEANGVHYLKLIGKSCTDNIEDIDADYSVDEDEMQRMILAAEQIIACERAKETA